MMRSTAFTFAFLMLALGSASALGGGFDPGGGGGGGVTVGDPVSGGTASRLLFSDASGNVATDATALGAGLTLTGALSVGTTLGVGGVATLTAATMTGQLTISGVTADITSGTNEDLTMAPNGTGNFVVAKTNASSTAEVLQTWTLADVTDTKFFLQALNATSTNAVILPMVRGFSNSTTDTHAGLQFAGYMPTSEDTISDSGMVGIVGGKSTDGATGTISALTAAPIVFFRNYTTDKAFVTWGGAFASPADTLTVADNGAGTNATGTLNPASGYARCTCNDTNGCDITVGETAIKDGQELTISCTAANACNFADTAGVTELAGAYACGQYDSLTLIYASDRWVEKARSNN